MKAYFEGFIRLWCRLANSRSYWPLILLLAVTVKGAYFLEARHEGLLTLNQLRAMDMEKFLNWARILADHGRWLSDFSTEDEGAPPAVVYNSFHQSPLYPYFMAGVYKLTGVSTVLLEKIGDAEPVPVDFPGYFTIILVQQLLALVMLWPLHEIFRRLTNRDVACFLILLVVLCDVLVFFETILLREFLISFCYVWTLHTLLGLREKPTAGRALACGVWMGLSWVVKPNFMVLAPLILLWLVWSRPEMVSKKRWRWNAGLCLVAMLAILTLPVYRNLVLRPRAQAQLVAAGRWESMPPEGVNRVNPVPIFKMTTRGPYSYINGNSLRSASSMREIHPALSEDFIRPGMCRGIGWDFNTLKSYWYNQKFYNPDSRFARELLQQGPEDADWHRRLGDLGSIMKLVWMEHSREGTWFTRFWPLQGNKILASINGYEVPNNTNVNLARKFSKVLYFLPVGSALFCFVFVAGLPGLVSRLRQPEVMLVAGVVVAYLAITVAFYFIGRFRLPVLALMAGTGAAGCMAYPLIWQRGGWRRPALVSWLGLALLLAWPRDVRGGHYQENFEILGGIRYADYYNYALGRQVVDDPRGALKITSVGLAQRGSLTFSQLLRLHFWALTSLPEERGELMRFCRELESYYQGRHPDPVLRAPTRGSADAANNVEHAALYSLALDFLQQEESGNAELRALRRGELVDLWNGYGEVLLRERINITRKVDLAVWKGDR